MKTFEEVKKEIGEIVGEASMCWTPYPTGVFDSERATTLCRRLEELAKHGYTGELADIVPMEEKKGYAYGDIDLIIWDLETTGFVAPECKILEIGAFILRGDHMEHKHFVLDNKCEIPEKITEITGITKAIIDAEGGDPKAAIEEFLELVTLARKNVTHNGIRFDIPFLVAYAGDLLGKDKKWENELATQLKEKAFDTAVHFKAKKVGAKQGPSETFLSFANRVMDMRVFGVKFNLGLCCEEQKVDTSKISFHRAMGDVAMTYELYKAIAK